MQKTNIPYKHQPAPDPSNQESGSQTTNDLLSGLLAACHMQITTNTNVFFANILYHTLSSFGAWKQIEKCFGGLQFKSKLINFSSERQLSALPQG